MERSKIRRWLLSSKNLFVSPSTGRVNDLEVGYSHPPPSIHAWTLSQRPPLFFSTQSMGCQEVTRGQSSVLGFILDLRGLSTKLSQNWWWTSVGVLYPGFLFYLCAVYLWSLSNCVDLGWTVVSDQWHRKHTLKWKGRWYSVSLILTFLLLKFFS